MLRDQWLSQVHESNTQVLRHLKPVAAFLKPAPSSCWDEVGFLFAGVVVWQTSSCAEPASGNCRCLAAGRSCKYNWRQTLPCLCFTSCGQGKKMALNFFVCVSMTSALLEPGTGAKKSVFIPLSNW